MASLPQISGTLGAWTSRNKHIITPCIAQFCKKRHFNNLVARHQIAKPTLSQLTFVGQKKPLRDLKKQCQKEKWKAWCSDDDGVAPELGPPPPQVEVVQDFYKAFNAKDTQRLEQLLSDNCVYHDLLFYGPFEQKESVMNFLRNAMDALGPNIHISVEEVKHDHHLMATVFWHLEWKTKKIPFTNGCRFFRFEETDGKVLISKITGLEELPVKPGELVMKLLKAIRSLFDSYPLAAEAILDSNASQDGNTHRDIDSDFHLFGGKH